MGYSLDTHNFLQARYKCEYLIWHVEKYSTYLAIAEPSNCISRTENYKKLLYLEFRIGKYLVKIEPKARVLFSFAHFLGYWLSRLVWNKFNVKYCLLRWIG